MTEVVIIDAVRTPVGKRGGALSGIHAVDLSATVVEALVSRSGLEPGLVDEVIWGCVSQVGEQASNVGRLTVLAAGWPDTIPGTTVDRACGSSQQAVHFAVGLIASGQCDVIIAGGVETMSRVPMGAARRAGPGLPYGPRLRSRYAEAIGDDGEFSQGTGAEVIARRWRLSRAQLDEYSLQSHHRAAAAVDSGAFDAELVPVRIDADDSCIRVVESDEGIRRGTSIELMGTLPTVFAPDGVVTAGNSSQISDGASAALIMSRSTAARLGLRPLARFHSFASVGVDPVEMLTGPIPATEAALERGGLAIGDIDTFEVNEAFASVICAWLAETQAVEARVNRNGGAIALGHPLGASGTRLLATMVHQLHRSGGRYGLQTMCEGGGMANALIVEALP
jgi:acetyl-CoA acyltransferase